MKKEIEIYKSENVLILKWIFCDKWRPHETNMIHSFQFWCGIGWVFEFLNCFIIKGEKCELTYSLSAALKFEIWKGCEYSIEIKKW